MCVGEGENKLKQSFYMQLFMHEKYTYYDCRNFSRYSVRNSETHAHRQNTSDAAGIFDGHATCR